MPLPTYYFCLLEIKAKVLFFGKNASNINLICDVLRQYRRKLVAFFASKSNKSYKLTLFRMYFVKDTLKMNKNMPPALKKCFY